MRPQIRIYTNDGKFIDREMNDAEFAQYELDSERTLLKAEAEAEAENKRQAAIAKLALLGLDTDDLKALGL